MLDKSRKYGEVWGVAPVAGARFYQDGNYYGANGEPLGKPDMPKPAAPAPAPVVTEPPAAPVAPTMTIGKVEPAPAAPAPAPAKPAAKPASKAKAKVETKGSAKVEAKVSLEDELMALAGQK